jgi:O-antigen ligase
MTPRLQTAILIISVALLPLDFQPLRFEPHEPHRAGLLIILVLLAFPTFRRLRFSPLLIAVVIWCIALLLSTIFALSPSRALWGDLIRRMGLLTQLALVAGVFFGAAPNPSRLWRWFWLAGVIVAVYVCLQSVGLIPGLHPDNRPSGPLGVPTFTGGWLVLAGLWAALGMMRETIPQFWRKLAFACGLALMLIALILTESRGAALALAVGCTTAALLWAAVHRARWLALAIPILLLLLVGGVVAITHLNWNDTPLSNFPLIGRLKPAAPDLPRQTREAVWANSLALVREWPVLTNIDGVADQWHSLRPLVGYGHETFEFLLRPAMPGERAIDRAHNDWLDTLLTTGWFGLLARLTLWLAAWWAGLKRLRLNYRGILLASLAGPLVAAILFLNTALLPVAMTFGALVGCWLSLLWTALRRAHFSVEFDGSTWLALTVLTAHIADLQFSFVTVATAWPVWLAIGLLLKPAPVHDDMSADTNLYWVWTGLAGAFLLRAGVFIGASGLALFLLLLVLAATLWIASPIPRIQWRWIVLFWASGWLATIGTTEIIALWDIALISISLLLVAKGSLVSFKPRPVLLAWLAPIWIVLVIWARDIAADIYLTRAMQLPDLPAASEIRPAISLRPWDDRLLAAAGNLALRAAVSTSDMSVTEWLTLARNDLAQAAALNGYDANYAYLLALTEEQFALISPNGDDHIDRADAYFAAATRLWPTQADFWREWARFTFDLRADAILAYDRVQHAIRLDPTDSASHALLVEIEAASQ